MSTPLATPDELGVYLGITVDVTRATLVMQLAHDLCESVIDPVVPAAKGTELGVAGRLYTNASSAHSAGIGSASVAYGSQRSTTGVGGLYLSRSEIRTLRRLGGRTGAFAVDLTALDADGDGIVDPPVV